MRLDATSMGAEASQDGVTLGVRAGSDAAVLTRGNAGETISLPATATWASHAASQDIMVPVEVLRLAGAESAYDIWTGLLKVLSRQGAATLGKVGVGPDGAYVASMAVSSGAGGSAAGPGNPVIYVATVRAGLYSSTDSGQTWRLLGFDGDVMTTVAVNPADARQVVCASNSGIFRSEDGGATWLPISGLAYPSSFAFDPSGRTLYALCQEGSLMGSRSSVFRSVDGGRTWTYRGSADTAGMNGRLLVDPRTGTLIMGADCSGDATGLGKVRYSLDGGTTWQRGTQEGIVAFSVTPDGSAIASSGLVGPAISRDSGKTWVALTPGIAPVPWVAPVFAGEAMLLFSDRAQAAVSKDMWETWQVIASPQGVPQASVYDGRNVYLACGGHIWKSQDCGVTWERADRGIKACEVTAMSLGDGGLCHYVGTEDGAVFVPGDDGDYCQVVVFGPASDGAGGTTSRQPWFVRKIISSPHDRCVAFAIVNAQRDCEDWRGGRAYHTTDGGKTWVVAPGLASNVTSFAFDPADPATVWCGQGEPDGLMGEDAAGGEVAPGSPPAGILVSRDGGATFVPAGLAGISITALQVDVRSRVWAGTRDGVYIHANAVAAAGAAGDAARGRDGWTQYYSGLSGREIRSLALDPFNADAAYVVTDGGLCVTQDGGNTWTSADPGLPWKKGVPWYNNLVEVAAHPQVNGLVFLRQGKTGLVWYSPNRGGEWFEVPGLRPGIDITGLAPDMGAGLYITTRGSGSAGIMWLKEMPAHPASPGHVPDAVGVSWTKGPVLEGQVAWRGGFIGLSGPYLQLHSQHGQALAVGDSAGADFEKRVAFPGFGTSFTLQAVSDGPPGTPEVAYATAGEYGAAGEDAGQGGPHAFFFRTRDKGATWEKMGEVPGGLASAFFSAGPNREFRVAAGDLDPDNLVVAGCHGRSSAVFYSLDGGLTWIPSTGVPDFSHTGVLLASDSGKNGFWLYVAGGGLYRSVNGGKSFSLVTRTASGSSLLEGNGRL
ncbi:MAG: hypothetical protein ACM3WT_04270, partial [Bacillota bacterium]